MRLSLLYPYGADDKAQVAAFCGKIGARTLYHLSLDKCFEPLCEDPKTRSYFLEVLSAPLQDAEAIAYRQAILQDFLGKRGFFDDLFDLYGKFTGLRDGHDREKQAMMRSIHATTAGAAAVTIMNLLQSNASTLRRAMAYVRSISTLFRGQAILSKGLKALAESADRVSQSPAYAELDAMCSSIEGMHAAGPLDYQITLNAAGQMENCALVDHKYLKFVDKDEGKKFFLFGKRGKDEDPDGCIRIHQTDDAIYDKVTTAPLVTLAEALDDVCSQLFEEFCGIGAELSFYMVAVTCVRELQRKNTPLCYPTIRAESGMNITGLRDLELLLTFDRAEDVIPNDFATDTNGCGVVVFGENGSGKTVYLRSVGTAQLLAQAGLPVPAELASLSIRTMIVTQFSEAEKEFEKGNDAGRFEQEVRELAAVVDDLPVGALVLMNETFQTTAYDEGAEGLYSILEYFSEEKMQWMLVSHLHQLEDKLANDPVHLLVTVPGFKVQEKK